MKEQTAEIVAAYVRNNAVSPNDVPAIITQVYRSLSGLGQPQPAAAPRKPAVPIRQSVNPDYIICLECGVKGTLLRRHLANAHDLMPADYRERWQLPTEYPLVAPRYAARRSEMAKATGLGINRGRGNRAPGRARKRA